jgi:crossover junction endodeoxyribonuclease RusA
MARQTMTVEQLRKHAAKPTAKRKTKREWLDQFAATPPAPKLTDSERHAQRSLFDVHDAAVYRFRIPLAPTANKHWVPFIVRGAKPHAALHLSDEAQAFREHVCRVWQTHWNGWPPEPLTGRLRLCLLVHPRNAAETDSDNRIKPTQDALAHAGVYANDSQIKSLRVEEGAICRPHGAIDVILETIPEA